MEVRLGLVLIGSWRVEAEIEDEGEAWKSCHLSPDYQRDDLTTEEIKTIEEEMDEINIKGQQKKHGLYTESS